MTLADAILDAARGATRDLGTDLVELDGWTRRTNRSGATAASRLDAVMLHDTVTGAHLTRAGLARLLRDGYTGLPGPIANGGLERDGALILVSVPAANHAGAGGRVLDVDPGQGNRTTYGLEVANRGLGSGERWTGPQFDVSVAFTARLADNLGRDRGRFAVGHREYARGRKVDPWAVDLAGARRTIAAYRPPTSTPAEGSDLEEFLVSLSTTQRRALETLASLDPDEALEVVRFAQTIGRRESSGMGVANAAIDDHRQRLAIGFDGAGYQAAADLADSVDEFGSGVRGFVTHGLALIREARAVGFTADPRTYFENRLYGLADVAGVLAAIRDRLAR